MVRRILQSEEAAILLIIAASVSFLMGVDAYKTYRAGQPASRATQIVAPEASTGHAQPGSL